MRLKIGVAGVGCWGKNIASTLRRLVEFELVAVCDLAPRDHGVPWFAEFSQMLTSVRLDAVVIATPPETHAELAHAALAAGVHVLVEKPMCTSNEQAHQLLGAIEGAKARLMVGHILLFHPAVRGIERLREHGRLPGPLHVEVERWSPAGEVGPRCPWWTLAPHDLALLDRWFGAPSGVSLRHMPGSEVCAELEYSGGNTARLSLCTEAPLKRRRVSLSGGNNSAVFDDLDSHKLVLFEGARPRPVVIASEAPLDEELRHFAHALRSGARFEADALQGSRVVDVLEAGDRSAARGGEWELCAQELARYGS